MIRKATEEDLSRIAEIFVFNNRINYFPIFKQEEYSFGELQVVSMIDHYSFGYDGGMYNRSSTFNGTDISGSWGIMTELKDISFIEALSHAFRVAMVKGTNNTEMVRGGVVARDAMATVGNNMYLTTKDKLWEVNFDSQYKLYEGLTLAFELGYIYLDANKELWNDLYKENNFQAAFSVNYKF